MALIAQLLLPFFGGFAALLAARTGRDRERWVAIAAMAATLAALAAGVALGDDGRWLAFYRADWAPSFGIQVLWRWTG